MKCAIDWEPTTNYIVPPTLYLIYLTIMKEYRANKDTKWQLSSRL